jgi:hypothetical protein
MRKLVSLLVLVVPIFFISWTLVFIIYQGFDFGYYWKFLRQTFSLQGGVIVDFIRIYSILLTCFLMIIIYFWMGKK